jgi:predicted ribosomally synthesized peptide with nif11-like leader
MSKESVEQLMQAAGLDPALQKKLEGAEGFAEVMRIGAEKGYQFTEEEVQAFLSERGVTFEDSAEGELSEEALETVAGGMVIQWWPRIRGW